jgi:hypothetical protein
MEPIHVVEILPGSFAMVGMGQYQPHDPELPGFVSMGLARAEAVAADMRRALDELFWQVE